ncbi:hypothetical protein PMIN01_11734 [Paraphaeosphaeria minitans]|uniref:Uncharacterized protein n=1 Tax=Paraphaeosphaeria minitans TaxID=565426 RepID=A0A9P6G637_9PLEO|nr:hypothetical protein PMIN01_11734 [Paraphaeosphaeria minitans]
MPEQPPKKHGGEVHTFYSCCTNKESSSSETDNSNIAGIDDSSDGGFSTARIWLEFSAEIEKQVAVDCSSESGMTAYPLPPGMSNSRQKSPKKMRQTTERWRRRAHSPEILTKRC